MEKEYKMGDAELEVLKMLWKKGEPAASTEIVKELKELRGWEDTTIYTMLSKLVKKGFLTREKQLVSYYAPTITEQQYSLEQTRGLVNKLFGGNAKQLVSMLVENEDIDTKDVEELRRYWRKE